MSNIIITEKIILNEVAETLDDLTDVNAPAPLNGQSLVWNGTAWVPQTVSGGGGASVYTFDPEDPYGATGDGTNLTGSIKRNKLRGGGTGTLYDLFLGANVGAVELEDNRYVTGNISIDYTAGAIDLASSTWYVQARRRI